MKFLSRDGDNGDAHIGCTVYCSATDSRPVSGGGAGSRIAVPQVVVVTGGYVLYIPEGGSRVQLGKLWVRLLDA